MLFHHTKTDHPLENEYPKLVRDKIPEIIAQALGNDVPLRILADDPEFLSYLLKKVVEEAEELSQADTDSNLKEEIADIYEIIDAVIRMKNFSAAEISSIQSEKRAKRGGFEKRLLMLEQASGSRREIMAKHPNKERAIQFLKLASSGKVDEAYDQFISPAGKHHSPYFAAGFSALKTGMKENYQQFPNKQLMIKHVVSEDNIVVVHSHVVLKPGDLGIAALHLFRFEHEKIVELWDFGQPVSADSPNTDGLF